MSKAGMGLQAVGYVLVFVGAVLGVGAFVMPLAQEGVVNVGMVSSKLLTTLAAGFVGLVGAVIMAAGYVVEAVEKSR